MFRAVLLAMVVVSGGVHAAKLDSNGCYNHAQKGYVCPSQGTVQPWGHETTKERDKRLKRECKGKPNAGACLGHAS